MFQFPCVNKALGYLASKMSIYQLKNEHIGFCDGYESGVFKNGNKIRDWCGYNFDYSCLLADHSGAGFTLQLLSERRSR